MMELGEVKTNSPSASEDSVLSPQHIKELTRAIDDVELEETLKAVPLFSALTPLEITLLARELQPITVGDGDVIYRQGEQGDNFFIIVEGEVERIVENAQSRNKPAITVGKPLVQGCCFGQMALVNEDEIRSCSMRSKGETHLRCIGRDSFRHKVGDLSAMLKRSSSGYVLHNRQLRSRKSSLDAEMEGEISPLSKRT